MRVKAVTAGSEMSRSTSPGVWVGRALSGVAILFLFLDGALKIVPPPQVPETMAMLGWPTGLGTDLGRIHLLGATTLIGTALYAWPRTAMLGAVLLTAYLGGAVATHVRVGSPLFSHVLFGVYLGLFLWGGLWLRDPRLRALFPMARAAAV